MFANLKNVSLVFAFIYATTDLIVKRWTYAEIMQAFTHINANTKGALLVVLFFCFVIISISLSVLFVAYIKKKIGL